MKNIFKKSLIIALIMFSTSSIAGVLMSQWTEGTSRYCKYSDGEVVEISYGAICSSTN